MEEKSVFIANMDLFVAICGQLQSPAHREAAEHALSEFAASPSSMDDCQQVLLTVADPTARWQAASIIGGEGLRRWTSLGDDGGSELCMFFLRYALEQYQSTPPFVRAKLLQMLAVLWKRGALDGEGQSQGRAYDALFAQVKEAVVANEHEAQVVGMEALRALVEEYSTSKSSVLGLSLEFHRAVRRRFERRYILDVFTLAIGRTHALVASMQSGGAQQPDDAQYELLGTCLRLLVEILSWRFGADAYTSGDMGGMVCVASGAVIRAPMFRPGAAWREILLNDTLLPLAFDLYGIVQVHVRCAVVRSWFLVRYGCGSLSGCAVVRLCGVVRGSLWRWIAVALITSLLVSLLVSLLSPCLVPVPVSYPLPPRLPGPPHSYRTWNRAICRTSHDSSSYISGRSVGRSTRTTRSEHRSVRRCSTV